jgi:type II secretory pathway pseudopilin PulG
MTATKNRRLLYAFSLVEVVLAMGVVSFSVLATIGLLSVASNTNKNARDEGFAARLASNEFERLRSLSSSSSFWPATPGTLPNYSTRYYDSNLTDLGTTKTSNAVYAISITFNTAPAGTSDFLLDAEVRYPAQAVSANQSVFRFTTLMNTPTP